MRNKLRIFRICASLIITASLSTVIAVNSAAVIRCLGWSLHFQIISLMLGGATIQLLLWLAMTLIFGRVYCAAVCPLGTLQDIFFSVRKIKACRDKLPPMRYTQPNNRLRLSILAATLLCFIIGANTIAIIIEPVTIYSKFVRLITAPEGISALAGALTAAAIILVAFISAKRGRLWCNTICPIGTALGLISAHSHLRIDINPDYCTACGKCQDACKAEAINLAELRVDNSRCILCFNCMAVCEPGAISYTNTPHRPATPLFEQTSKR